MALAGSKFKNFIPTVWSARLLENLDKSLVGLQMVNRDYEGEISDYGDTVKINQLGDITIKDYTGADIDNPEELDSTQQTLIIDQARYFNFSVKDVDKAQANVDLIDGSMKRAAYAMADEIDTDIFTQLAEGAGNKEGTASSAIEITVDNAYDKLVDLGVKLDELSVPKAGRKIALPAWYLGFLAKDPRFTKDMNILANGVVEGATVGRFQLLQTNNLKTGTGKTVHAVAGTTQGMSFANQIAKTEAYRPESNFSDAVKGLSVWGRKVVQPDALVAFIIKPKVEADAGGGA